MVKVGSNVLTRDDGGPDVLAMASIVDQVAKLHAAGMQVILVSSGAVACGRSILGGCVEKMDSVEQRQLFSAVGQVKLMSIYFTLFSDYGINVGQVLTQKENFDTRSAYLNQRSCIEVMLRRGVVPVVNENDTTSMTELMFTDNDELSGLIASMMRARLLIILSNIDGIFTGDPRLPQSQLIPRVEPGDDLSSYISTAKSGFGRGGMGTKYGVARRLAEEGIEVIIANGKRPNILSSLIEHPETAPHTTFVANAASVSPIKRWIAHSDSFARGSIWVDKKAAEVLKSDQAVSLLPIGLVKTEGEWEEGDLITIFDPDNQRIGVGRASIDSQAASQAMGKRGGRPVVHYDYLYIDEIR